MKIIKCLLLILLTFYGVEEAWAEEAPVWPLELINSRPHNAQNYTQGLFIHGGYLYESAGLYGHSAISREPFNPGQSHQPLTFKSQPLPQQYFGEGATLVEGDIYVITWREQTGFIFKVDDLSLQNGFKYEGEGWGLAYDGHLLWRSDGGDLLYPHLPENFAPAGEPLPITDGGKKITHINEMEWDPATGLMLANIYGSDKVAAIDLKTGQVRFWLDGGDLRTLASKDGLTDTGNPLDVALNGLALDGNSLWLTGKLWPRLYQVAWPPAQWQGQADNNDPVTKYRN